MNNNSEWRPERSGAGRGVLPYNTVYCLYGYVRLGKSRKGMVFKPFTLGYGLVNIENWSRIGSHLTRLLSRQKL